MLFTRTDGYREYWALNRCELDRRDVAEQARWSAHDVRERIFLSNARITSMSTVTETAVTKATTKASV